MKTVLGLILLFFSTAVLADVYVVSATWLDDAEYTAPNDDPFYRIEWRISDGTAAGPTTLIDAIPTGSHTWNVTAEPGDNIEIRVQAANNNGDLTGAWSNWVVAGAPYGPTQPGNISNIVITVTRQ